MSLAFRPREFEDEMQVVRLEDLRAKLGQKVYIVIPTGKYVADRFFGTTHSRIVEWVVVMEDVSFQDASGNTNFSIRALYGHDKAVNRGGIFTTIAEARRQQAIIALCGEFAWPDSVSP